MPTMKFVAGMHVNYAETVLPTKEGLTKLASSHPSSSPPANDR
jgi:hypothetical protein